ncbi:MAG: hypothetical protein ACI9H6_000328 [Patiriisocius sp.]|jgi:hypothetical protein
MEQTFIDTGVGLLILLALCVSIGLLSLLLYKIKNVVEAKRKPKGEYGWWSF